PVRAPQANSIAERVIGTLRCECRDHMDRAERAPSAVLREYIHYYNDDRPHQSLALQPPNGRPPAGSGRIISEPMLGGLHHVYRRAA
ncbi:MAG: integrase core domain-containing protein, partial [Myxococcota bacterium]